MKIFNIFSKIIYILFFVLTAVMLIFALTTLNQMNVIFPGLRYLGLFYLSILIITLITMIIHFIIIIKGQTKVFKVKIILKRVCIGALIKHHEYFLLTLYTCLLCHLFFHFFHYLCIMKRNKCSEWYKHYI